MATIETDRDGDKFVATWHTINGKQVRRFDSRADLNSFAIKKMGRTGCVIDSCDLTPEQRAAKDARDARARAFMAEQEELDRKAAAYVARVKEHGPALKNELGLAAAALDVVYRNETVHPNLRAFAKKACDEARAAIAAAEGGAK